MADYHQQIRADRALAYGRLIAAGCPAAKAKKLATAHTRKIWEQVIPDLRHEFEQTRAKTALREVLRGGK